MTVEKLSPLHILSPATLLEQCFGDGRIYLCRPRDRRGFRRAQSLGLVDVAGFVTPTGRVFGGYVGSSFDA